MHYIKIFINTNNPNLFIEALEEAYLYSSEQIINSIIINGVKGYEVESSNILELSFTQWEVIVSVIASQYNSIIIKYCRTFCANNNINLINITKYKDNTNYVTKNQTPSTIELSYIIIFNTIKHYNEYNGNKLKIFINASTAFGTGEHNTTLMCLQLLEIMYKENIKLHNILDIGTGSGILAIAAKKLFNNVNVIATDIDDITLLTANKFFTNNNVLITTYLSKGFVNLTVQKQHLILANILLEPLLELKTDFYNNLEENGYVIISGILNTQLPELTKYYSSHFSIYKILEDNNWVAIILKKIKL